jgi:hypothetical protein
MFYDAGLSMLTLRLKYANFPNKLVLVPGKLVHPSLMFADKARAYLIEAPFRFSTVG